MNKKLIFGLIALWITGIAHSSPTFPPAYPYSDAMMEAYGCDKQVYARLFEMRKAEWENMYSTAGVADIRQQAQSAPSSQGLGNCVQGAINQINQIANQVKAVMAVMGGSVDWGSMAQGAIDQISAAACNQVNNYTSGLMATGTQSYTSGVNSVMGQVSGLGINTQYGSYNVGGQVLSSGQQTAGSTPTITTQDVNSWTSGINPFK